jgi:hypothetical protein
LAPHSELITGRLKCPEVLRRFSDRENVTVVGPATPVASR